LKFDTSNNQQPSIPKQSPLSRLLYHLSFNGSPTGSTAFERPHSPPESGRPLKYRPRQSCYSGLRSVLLYPRAVYPAMIFLNLLLRMTWSIRLSTHVHATRDGTLVFFWLEVAELVRRWLWVFVRVEWGGNQKGTRSGSANSLCSSSFTLFHLLLSFTVYYLQCQPVYALFKCATK
jgi:EXS family